MILCTKVFYTLDHVLVYAISCKTDKVNASFLKTVNLMKIHLSTTEMADKIYLNILLFLFKTYFYDCRDGYRRSTRKMWTYNLLIFV